MITVLATLGYLVAEVYHPLYDGKIPAGLGAISQVPAAGWLQIIAAIGIVELTVGKQDFENKAPGDLGFGLAFNPFPDDAEKFAALQLKELKNGRLAMMGECRGVGYMFAAALLTCHICEVVALRLGGFCVCASAIWMASINADELRHNCSLHML